VITSIEQTEFQVTAVSRTQGGSSGRKAKHLKGLSSRLDIHVTMSNGAVSEGRTNGENANFAQELFSSLLSSNSCCREDLA
jgi:hypothetical protein